MSQQVSVTVAQTSASASAGTVRGHRVAVDRPEAKGGTDSGPMGGELFLVGLGGCFMSNLLAAAAARGVAGAGFSVAVTGTVDGTPARFQAVELRVTGQCEPALLAKLAAIAERGCLVANTVRPAVELRVVVG